MKKIFLGHYQPSKSEFNNLWCEGTFIFDTSALLNLYGYPSSLLDVFYSVLENIKDRIWMPYHVALEFHNNRFATLRAEKAKLETLSREISTCSNNTLNRIQNLRLEDRDIGAKNIRKSIEHAKKRLSGIDDHIKKAIKKQQTVSIDDAIANKLAYFFDGKTGSKIDSQETLLTLLTDASDRYARKNPPGFKDAEKKDLLYDCAVKYEKKYGDLIIWKQILAHAKENGIHKILFITDDRKEDWWWTEDGNTLGPLPDLRQEAYTVAEIDTFWMYTFEGFMDHAKTHFKGLAITDKILTNISQYHTKINRDDIAIRNYSDHYNDIFTNIFHDIFKLEISEKYKNVEQEFSCESCNTENLFPIARWIFDENNSSKISIKKEYIITNNNNQPEIFYHSTTKSASAKQIAAFISLQLKAITTHVKHVYSQITRIHLVITLQNTSITMGDIDTIMNSACPTPHNDFPDITIWIGTIIDNKFMPITSRSSLIK